MSLRNNLGQWNRGQHPLNFSHGESHGRNTAKGETKEYGVWRAMKERCLNRNNKRFPRYGLRGIAVCCRWIYSFPNFLKDMGRCPKGMTLERRNNNKGYTPSNCRWASRMDQANNKHSNHRIRALGQVKTLAQWCRLTGITDRCFYYRIECGWSEARAVTTPSSRKKPSASAHLPASV
jgi:hypothetical protein